MICDVQYLYVTKRLGDLECMSVELLRFCMDQLGLNEKYYLNED